MFKWFKRRKEQVAKMTLFGYLGDRAHLPPRKFTDRSAGDSYSHIRRRAAGAAVDHVL